MKVTLLNIGTSQRTIANLRSAQVSIPIGVLTEADIHENLYKRIKRREQYDSLIILDEDAGSVPVKMQVVLDILREFDGIPYDRLLGQVNEIMGAEPGKIVLRPTRESMRAMLVAAARLYASKKFGVTPNYNKRLAEAMTKKPLAYAKSKNKAVADEKDVTVDPFAALDTGAEHGGVEDDDEFEKIEREEADAAKAEREAERRKAEEEAKAKAQQAKADDKPKAKRKPAKAPKKGLPRKRR